MTAGHGVEKDFAAEFKAKNDDYSTRSMAQALGDRLAEAMAEMFHKRAREACRFRQDGESQPTRNSSAKNIAGCVRRRVIRRVRITTEKPILFELLGVDRRRRASSSRRVVRCTRRAA